MLCRRMHSNQPGKGNWYVLFCLDLMITNVLQTIIEVSIESRIPAAKNLPVPFTWLIRVHSTT